ncbi:MAG: acyltransferase family protein [Proteobacteria bacterium]|nr:acyltransferase family protein [Pseudomonadota bacterium]
MQDNRRYYSLDALRGSMMMLGIVLHGSQWYITEPPGGLPLPHDGSTSYLFDLIMHFIHSFRMPLFFVLAGFFASLLVGKRGLTGTYINRLQRIGVPLLLAIFTILPLTMAFLVSFMASARFGTHQFLITPEQLEVIGREMKAAGMPTDQPSLGHLWFLYYLLYFYLLIPVCFLFSRWSLKLNLRPLVTSPFLYVGLSLYTVATLWHFRGGVLFEGFIFITPHLPSLVYYGSFFMLGYLFHYHRGILDTFNQHLWWFVGLSVVLFPLAIYFTGLDFATEASGQFHLHAVVSNAFLTWSLIYVFMGLFLRFLDFKSPWILYLSNSSYWVYLLHMPVVCAIAWLLFPYALPAVLKFLIVVTATAVICLTSYHYLVQHSWLSVRLNGMKFNALWPWVEARNIRASGEVTP